jgi:hypothetical protein
MNEHLIVGVDGFTKFTFLRAVRSTRTRLVVEYLRDIFATYGVPRVLITDRGSAFTSHDFEHFCNQNDINHIKVALSTPRANGQVERLNDVVGNALKALREEEDRWDDHVCAVQFAVNNTVNQSTKRTPSQLLLGYVPRGTADAVLRDEVALVPSVIEDIVQAREEAAEEVRKAQAVQKKSFDARRKVATQYCVGDQVLVEQQHRATGSSKKLKEKFRGPLVVTEVLPHDRYRVKSLDGARGNRVYSSVVAADRMKHWTTPGGVSDDSGSEEEQGSGKEEDAIAFRLRRRQ